MGAYGRFLNLLHFGLHQFGRRLYIDIYALFGPVFIILGMQYQLWLWKLIFLQYTAESMSMIEKLRGSDNWSLITFHTFMFAQVVLPCW